MMDFTKRRKCRSVGVLAVALLSGLVGTPGPVFSAWTVGKPIVSYWCGPALTNANAEQMASGGWNLVWAKNLAEFDQAEAHGLRAIWYGEWDDATVLAIRNRPGLYAYYTFDEPSAAFFPELAPIVSHLHTLDPNHPTYVNLWPSYSSNADLGANGYADYLNQYISIVKPEILCYDHYQFETKKDWLGRKSNVDTPDYFKNLAIVSHTAKDAGIPFMNVIQAAAWSSMRLPNGNELRYLYNTSLAYGAAGVSDFVYSYTGFNGGMANADGTATTLYDAAKTINPNFVAIAQQVQSMKHIGAYHLGDLPPGYGTTDGSSPMRLPGNSPFTLSGLPDTEYVTDSPVKGAVLGLWGLNDELANAMFAMVVNLNYSNSLTTTVTGPDYLSIFDPTTNQWAPTGSRSATLILEPGGSILVGLTLAIPEPSPLVVGVSGMLSLLCGTWWKRSTSKRNMAQ